MRGNPTILARIVALVAVALLAALAAMLLVTFRGPPPHTRPISLDEVATAIRTGRSPTSDWSLKTTEKADTTGMRPAFPMLTRELTTRLGPDFDNVRLYVSNAPRRGPFPNGPGGPGGRPPFPPPSRQFIGGMPILHDAFLVTWDQDGAQHSFRGKQGAPLGWYAITFALMALIFVLLLLPTWYVARRITNPLRRLAEGGSAGGTDDQVPLPVGGPPEVRHLGEVFNRMRGQLVDHVTERTAMLVAIAHDLRTPMMRLSFRLDQLPEVARAKAEADIEEMRQMVATLLDFVRSGNDAPVLVRMELSALVETFVADMESVGAPIELGSMHRAVIAGDAALLRRCIGNLVENALRYGGNARLSLTVAGRRALLTVEDDGPGVPGEKIARLTEPFYRGEGSRNRATGGAGLGLSIARSIAEKHGGSLSVANRAEGGLRATVSLPLAE